MVEKSSLVAVNWPSAASGNTFNADNEMAGFNSVTLSYDANGNLVPAIAWLNSVFELNLGAEVALNRGSSSDGWSRSSGWSAYRSMISCRARGGRLFIDACAAILSETAARSRLSRDLKDTAESVFWRP